MRGLGYTDQTMLNGLHIYVNPSLNRREARILVHPLWTETHPARQVALQAVQDQHPRHNVECINPFRAVRRPSDSL
jgi:DEAD/DEAH box helicase domain-containing protein